MSAIPSSVPAGWRRRFRARVTVRGLRLASGLILLTYVTTHLLNHALGNVSLRVMEAVLERVAGFWRLPPVGAVLYGALAVHLALAVWAIYARPRFDWRPSEMAQIAFGLALPPLLISHVVATRLAYALNGSVQTYAQQLRYFWVDSPLDGAWQAVALLAAWAHGCIGLHLWLRLKPGYARVAPVLLCAAVLVPVLALLGYAQAGQDVATHISDPAWRARYLPAPAGSAYGGGSEYGSGYGSGSGASSSGSGEYGSSYGSAGPGAGDPLATFTRWLLIGLGVALLLALSGRLLRRVVQRRRGLVRLTYPDGRVASVPRGLSVLEASRACGIPHASVCGGRGRCSTCRVRLMGDKVADLAVPSAAEQAVLDRIGAGAGVRLACQVRPTGDLSVAPLLPPRVGARDLRRRSEVAAFGEERFVAALFVDLRGSTRLAERGLPFDTVFVINRFLEPVGGGVVAAGGQPNQFLGDGMMALFGIGTGPAEAARQGLAAIGLVAARIDALNGLLGGQGEEPIRFGLGLHAGTAILGEIGDREHGRAVFTAIGDPVNVASRLQGLTKRLGCEALVSEAVFKAAGIVPDLPVQEVEIDGREGRLMAYPIVRAREPWAERADPAAA